MKILIYFDTLDTKIISVQTRKGFEEQSEGKLFC